MMRLPASLLTDLARQMIQGSLVGLMTLAPAAAALGQSGTTMTLRGTAFDFRNSHPDFSVIPSHGYGHYAGNVEMMLGAGGVPVLSGAGYKVTDEWRDATSTPIAPHMFQVNGGGGAPGEGVLIVNGQILLRDTGSIDAWDPALGPYGPGNEGMATVVSTNGTWPGVLTMSNASMIVGNVLVGPGGDTDIACDLSGTAQITGTSGTLTAAYAMPEIAAPTGMGPSTGDVVLDDPGVTILSANMHVNSFMIENHAEIEVSGNVTILSEGPVEIRNHGVVRLLDGATLTIYSRGSVFVRNHAEVNVNTADPTRLTIYNLGSDDMDMRNGGQIYAMIVAPDAYMEVRNDCDIYGGFIGKTLEVRNNGAIHVAGGVAPTGPACLTVNDTAGTQGPASSGGISSANSFAQWYDEVLGVNMPLHHAITLVPDADGVWEYLDDSFYPIDGKGFGNGPLPHNYYFTFAVDADFTFEACGGQFIEFVGCDDMWVFINGELVMDVGGVIPAVIQRVDLDRLDLEDGQPCRMQLFYAQRQANHGVFRLRTSIDFDDEGSFRVSGIFD